MAVNKPIGDNARNGAVPQAQPTSDHDGRQEAVDQAQKGDRCVYGQQEGKEVQGRTSGEVRWRAAQNPHQGPNAK